MYQRFKMACRRLFLKKRKRAQKRQEITELLRRMCGSNNLYVEDKTCESCGRWKGYVSAEECDMIPCGPNGDCWRPPGTMWISDERRDGEYDHVAESDRLARQICTPWFPVWKWWRRKFKLGRLKM